MHTSEMYIWKELSRYDEKLALFPKEGGMFIADTDSFHYHGVRSCDGQNVGKRNRVPFSISTEVQ